MNPRNHCIRGSNITHQIRGPPSAIKCSGSRLNIRSGFDPIASGEKSTLFHVCIRHSNAGRSVAEHGTQSEHKPRPEKNERFSVTHVLLSCPESCTSVTCLCPLSRTCRTDVRAMCLIGARLDLPVIAFSSDAALLPVMRPRAIATQTNSLHEQWTRAGQENPGDVPDGDWWQYKHLVGTLHQYLERIRPSLSEAVSHTFQRCDLPLQRRVLTVMRGYELGWPSCPWSNDEFMQMLIVNEDRVYPHVWTSTFIAETLSLYHRTLPDVKQWLLGFDLHGKPLKKTAFVSGVPGYTKLRYEQWVFWTPTLRQERVLAYRARPDGVCTCCQQLAFWKTPCGRRGCAVHITRSVAQSQQSDEWHAMAKRLSRSGTSRFERMVVTQRWFSSAVFEALFIDLYCLSCSCGLCSSQDMRAGVLCPADKLYLSRGGPAPGSPRDPTQPLIDGQREAVMLHPLEMTLRRRH